MNEVKVNNQDGLIYFNNFRVRELILLKSEGEEDEYRMIVDIQSYDYPHSQQELDEFERKFEQKVNNQLDYVWVKFEELCNLDSIDELNGLELGIEDCKDKYLYFGWHTPLYNNKLVITKSQNTYLLSWGATSDDAVYYDERATENKVQINCELDLYLFKSEEDWQKHDKLRNKQRDYYFAILNQLNGRSELNKDELDLSEISNEFNERQKNERQKQELAWEIAKKKTKI